MVGGVALERGFVERQELQGHPPDDFLDKAPKVYDRFPDGQFYLSTAEVGGKHQEAQEEGERAV